MEQPPPLEHIKSNLTPSVLEQGTNQRIGDSVKLRRIEWDLQVQAGDNFNVTVLLLGLVATVLIPQFHSVHLPVAPTPTLAPTS